MKTYHIILKQSRDGLLVHIGSSRGSTALDALNFFFLSRFGKDYVTWSQNGGYYIPRIFSNAIVLQGDKKVYV